MGNEPLGPGKAGAAADGEGLLLQRIWGEVEPRVAGSRAAPQDAPAGLPPAADAARPGSPEHGGLERVGPEHERLLQSARAVHALNERLGLAMDAPAHRLARDRMTAFVAKVSALSGVRPDELVIGSGSDAFVVQNDAAGRTIAKFDTHDAVNAPVGDSLDGLAAASARRAAGQEAQQQELDRQQLAAKAQVMA